MHLHILKHTNVLLKLPSTNKCLGEVHVLLFNFGGADYEVFFLRLFVFLRIILFFNTFFPFSQVNVGDRVAQLICECYSRVSPVVVDGGALEATERGEGGFGSTGVAGEV
jgi:hypothetical protein